MKNFFSVVVLLCSTLGLAQIKKDTTKLDDVVLVQKIPKQILKSPYQVDFITAADIDFQNFQTTAEMLSNSGALFVQKSQQGGGSPSIRGFEASRVLLVVDGVRMNNLIFRAGHLQNVITVDESFLDNAAIVYGPTSTLFGSDALGGTVAMNTKNAKFKSEVANAFSGNIASRYSSANQEKSVALQINYAANNWASLTAFSFNDFGDLKMGKRKNHNGDFFGERPFFVSTINGVDVIQPNDNKFVQRNSGYKQYNLMQKIAYIAENGFMHDINFQWSTSSDIPRYDRLTEPSGSAGLRHAEWYYGPQERLLAVYSSSKKKFFWNTDVRTSFSYQNVKESRHNRRFGDYVLQNRLENVNVYGLSLDLTKKWKAATLLYGLESYYETLNSTAFSSDINTKERKNISTRYPNGANAMWRYDAYASYNQEWDSKTFLNAGLRLGYSGLNSSIADDSFFPLPFSKIKQQNFTYSANVGVVRNVSSNVSLKSNLSTGYRVPNIDDLAKIFETVRGILIVPNEDLKPEKTVTADLGFVFQSSSKKWKLEQTYFYTKMFDAIVTSPFLYKGQSSLVYDGALSQVFANQNSGKAFVTGISTSLQAELVTAVQMNASFNYNLGRIVSERKLLPLDHISPYFGKVGISYTYKKGVIEGYMLYNGKKALKDYSSSGEDNLQYAPANGMPAWESYSLKSSYKLFEGAIVYTGVENILDTQYRTFSSGINAPGRNFYGGLQYTF
jgi:hemoglobin/transferrin/lactoferrin receptor protein